MKIRNGFVSNSSSSSFIVAFKKKPKSVEEMRTLLFGENKEALYGDPYDGSKSYSQETVATEVFNDLETALSNEDVLEEVRSGYFEGYPQLDYSSIAGETIAEKQQRWQEQSVKIYAAAKELADKFIAENKKMKFYVFTYSDNEGDFQSSLEHGDLFRRLPHLVISHH